MASAEKQPLAQHAHMTVSPSDGSSRCTHAVHTLVLFQNRFSNLPFSSSESGMEFKALLVLCDLCTTELYPTTSFL